MLESNGFPCPGCGAAIKVDVARLLAAAPVFCSGCGLKLQLDPNASASALEAARNYQVLMRNSRLPPPG